MARSRPSDPTSSDDDAPEVVSHSISKSNAKRAEKTIRGFEAEENARKKSQNRERDRKLKERAVVTRMGKLSDNALRKGKRKAEREPDLESDGGASEGSAEDGETPEDSALEMRMRRAMEDAAAEIGDGDDEDNNGDPEDLSDEDMDGGSGESGIGEEMSELDTESGLEEDGEVEDASMEDESGDEDEDQILPLPMKSSAKAQYLEDGLFASAFASQNTHAVDTATKLSQKVQPSRKRQRRPLKHAKDLLVGTRTIRTLPNPLRSKIRSTAHTIPPQKIRKFIDQRLALKGKLTSAKARGWERRPVNVGVMKCTGAPSGFVRGSQ
ncbi:hypothetical protein AZE42_02068 [Rhizopogon vesiculosus]|uniref:Uncharacterized protein n=1 Tax=Rhizopogon vesiculosus TaxID=180088 RepID=A0A1J8Q3F1_9AGAM|nr:hypothetical protein AZE42_02068 [Rhizopogon vesiculosus]